jgi:hypothetical protein
VWLSLPASIHNIAESEAEFNLLAITTTTTITINTQHNIYYFAALLTFI